MVAKHKEQERQAAERHVKEQLTALAHKYDRVRQCVCPSCRRQKTCAPNYDWVVKQNWSEKMTDGLLRGIPPCLAEIREEIVAANQREDRAARGEI